MQEEKKMQTVQMMNTAPVNGENKEETVEATEVNLDAMNRTDILAVAKQYKQAAENYEHAIEESKKKHQEEINRIQEYYQLKVNEKNSILEYYERKFKLLEDILKLETGGKKND